MTHAAHTTRRNPPYRAEHLGSLVRPPRLIAAREDWRAGKVSRAALTAIEDECIREAVALQERAGLQVLSDGEFRKWSWRDLLFDASDGFAPSREPSDFTFTDFDGRKFGSMPVPQVIARIRRREMMAPGMAFVRGLTTRTIKATLPAPSVAHFFRGDKMLAGSPYQGDRNAYLADVATIYRKEIADLVAQGCAYLQFDDVPTAMLCDARNRDIVRARGEDPDRLIDEYFALFRDVVRDAPRDMTLGVHLCRGNIGHGLASGGYDPVAARLFALPVHAFFLEYDTARAGGFEPLAHLPADKIAVLGLMSTKLAELEPIDDLRRKVDQAAKFVPLERLGLSPQCGFASGYNTTRFSAGDVERKLAHLVTAAAAIWGGH